MNRTAQHPVLRVDLDFINFLESDQVSFYFDSTQNILDSLLTFILQKELPRAVNTAALSGAAVVRLFNKVGETVNKITYKMDENDPVSRKASFCLFMKIYIYRFLSLVVRRQDNRS